MVFLKPSDKGIPNRPSPKTVIDDGNTLIDELDMTAGNANMYGANFKAAADATAVKSKCNLIILGIAAVVAGLGAAILMAASFSRPIHHAMKASEEIASGNFASPIVTKRHD